MVSEDKLKKIIEQALEDRSRMDLKEHYEHHEFIAEFIEKERVKRERWETVWRQLLGWGLIGLVGILGKAVAEFLKLDL